MFITLGIDPGKKGGLMALNQKREILLKETMPEDPMDTYSILREFYKSYPEVMIYLESASPRPINGVKSIHSFAFHNGQIDMIIQILKMRYELIPPNVWCRTMHAGTSDGRPKERSMQAVKRLFPNESFLDTTKAKYRTMHDGLIDALLIAEFGMRKLESVSKT